MNNILETTQEEEWREVKGYEKYYEVSNLGRVRGVGRFVKHSVTGQSFRKPKIISQSYNNHYYQSVLFMNGTRLMVITHRLVAIAFIPNPENKPCVNHINGIKTDNRVENLEWATASENTVHAHKNGLVDVSKGSNHYRSILTEDQVREIKYNQKDKGKAIDLRNTFTQALQGMLMKSHSTDSFTEQAFKFLEKKGYQALLGGVTRPAVDFSSNLMYAGMWKPSETMKGFDIMWKHRNDAGLLSNIAKNVKSTELTRMYDTVGLSSKYGDASGSKGIKKKINPPTMLAKVLDKTKIDKIKDLYDRFDQFNDFTTSAPDQIVARALFHGVLDTEFKTITGKELDLEIHSIGLPW